jgi:UrcA family protein
MTKFASRFAGVAMIALAALPAFALTHAANAAEPTARIAVGNLNSPTQAARFDAELNAQADSFCTAEEKAPYEGSKVTVSHAACVQAFRSEALSQLSNSDRTAVQVAAANSSVQVAGR